MRLFTNEPLYVEPALVGARLASPMRRFLAFGVDLVLIVIPTVAFAIGAAIVTLEVTDPRAVRAVVTLLSLPRSERPDAATTPSEQQRAQQRQQTREARKRDAFRDLVPLLVRIEAQGLPEAARVAAEEGDRERAADALKAYEVQFILRFGETAEKIDLPPQRVVFDIGSVIPGGIRAIALLGVPALYFVLLTRSRRGATIGKWLLGIRVVRLDAERLSILESLERFVGYVHIPATFFLTLADLWRDPNRRLPHDRAVHTAVFRMPRRAASPSNNRVHAKV